MATKKLDSSLLETLAHVGLSDKQAATYLALLELGQSPASRIAERTKINRSVTYETIKELMKSGYVSESAQTKVKQFIAADPDIIFQSARAHFESFRFLLPVLRRLQTTQHTQTCMEIFEGREAVAHLFQANDVASDRRFISCFDRMQRTFPEEMKRWVRRTRELKQSSASTKLLLVPNEAGRAYARSLKGLPHQQFRFFSAETDFAMDISIIRDTVMLVSFDPVCAVVIRSEDIARSARSLFDLLWNRASK